MRIRLILAAVSLSAAVACAPRTVVVPEVTTPRFPDFVRPVVPAGLLDSRAVAAHERAWRFLQAGDLASAEREVALALRSASGFYPADTIAGYVALARRDGGLALERFDRALDRRADYAPALAGKGEAFELIERDFDAVTAFEAALAADRSLPEIARRLEVARLRGFQREVANARDAAGRGAVDEAVSKYRSAIERSPDSAFLHKERGALARRRGNNEALLAALRRATELDPADAASLVQVGDLLAARADADGALAAYAAALLLEPDPSVEARRDALRARVETGTLPEEYRALASAASITRGDLAALIAVRLAPLLAQAPSIDPGVMTDLRGHWAERWVVASVRAGIMDPFDNHTFQPRTVVRRGDLALAVERLLSIAATANPSRAAAWRNAQGRFADLAPGHLAYTAASVAIAAGVMTSGPGNAFDPSRLATGAEAIDALERVRAAAIPSAAGGNSP